MPPSIPPQTGGFGDGWQTFMRFSGLGLQPDSQMGAPQTGMPGAALPNRPSTGIHTPQAYDYRPDEYLNAEVEGPGGYGQYGSQSPILDAFKQSVLNPPQRKQMTYPANTLAGFHKGLEIAATPTDYEKNRVYVDGHPYQQTKVYTDPATGQKKFINKYKQPGFWEQFMKAMPASVEPVANILNQPYADAVADWELKNKGLVQGANAEAQSALANYREAQAGAVPQTSRARLMQAEASLIRANATERLSLLKDLTDSERIDLLNRNKISLAEYNATARMAQIAAQQTGANERNAANIKSRETIAAAALAGRISIANMNNLSDEDLERLRFNHSIQLEGVRDNNQREQIILRAIQDRQTKAAPTAGGAGEYPTQQRVALQRRVSDIIAAHPDWGPLISFNDQGFPIISSSAGDQYEPIYTAIYGKPLVPEVAPPALPPPPPSYGAPPKAPGAQVPPPSGVPMTGGGNAVNQSPIGGAPDSVPAGIPQELSGVNTGFGQPPKQASPQVPKGTVLVTKPDGTQGYIQDTPENRAKAAAKQWKVGG